VAQEVRPDGLVVCALCPGLTRSEFHQRAAVHSTGGVAHGAPEWAWMSATDVVDAGLRALLAGRSVVVPGLLNKALVTMAGAVPGGVRRRVAAVARRRSGGRS
jgi:short-subunit dehydrogenase